VCELNNFVKYLILNNCLSCYYWPSPAIWIAICRSCWTNFAQTDFKFYVFTFPVMQRPECVSPKKGGCVYNYLHSSRLSIFSPSRQLRCWSIITQGQTTTILVFLAKSYGGGDRAKNNPPQAIFTTGRHGAPQLNLARTEQARGRQAMERRFAPTVRDWNCSARKW